MNKPTGECHAPISGVIPAAVIAAGLTGPVAWSAPGDLDPTFGDVGRAVLPQDLSGAVWSLEAMNDDGYLLAGEGEYCDYYTSCVDIEFAASLSSSGVPDAAYVAAIPNDVRASLFAAQKDGKLVGVGHGGSTGDAIVIYRLASGGSLDASFGTSGKVTFDRATIDSAANIAVDPDGRVVVYGEQHATPTMIRLMPDGSRDPSFGTNGVARLPADAPRFVPSLVRDPGGAYRILDGAGDDCHVYGVTASGNVDSGLGDAGSVALATITGSAFHCTDLDVLPDGRLMVAGRDGAGADVVRLSANGALDAAFSTNLGNYLGAISAAAVSPSGSVFVTGTDRDGLPGIVVARLLPNGRVDTGFGADGKAWVDVQGDIASYVEARVLTVPNDDHVLISGRWGPYWYARPYVARLTMHGEGPGVIGIKTAVVQAQESEQQVTIVVRRTGGSSGAVSVGYRTSAAGATAGEDFEAVQGRLEWASGETGDKTVVVPILSDQVAYEKIEQFVVFLDDPLGGGLGLNAGVVNILGDGYPHGAFRIRARTTVVNESDGTVTFLVSRGDGGSGAVSVTVQPVSGSAAQGTDFDVGSVTLAWADGDMSEKTVSVRIINDGVSEPNEGFSMTLSNPMGEAVIDPGAATATVTIQDAPQSQPQSNKSGGGGRTGPTGLLLLGLLALRRLRARLAHGNVARDHA